MESLTLSTASVGLGIGDWGVGGGGGVSSPLKEVSFLEGLKVHFERHQRKTIHNTEAGKPVERLACIPNHNFSIMNFVLLIIFPYSYNYSTVTTCSILSLTYSSGKLLA